MPYELDIKYINRPDNPKLSRYIIRTKYKNPLLEALKEQ